MQMLKINADYFGLQHHSFCTGFIHNYKNLATLLKDFQCHEINTKKLKDYFTAPLTLTQQSKFNSDTILASAVQLCAELLSHIAEQSHMVIAITDVSTTIIWTASAQKMISTAKQMHLAVGAKWSEAVIGTNAFALAQVTRNSVSIMGQQNYLKSRHNWVFYAAPIIDPVSKTVLGVVNLSTQSDQHNVLGTLAAEQCAIMIENKILEQQRVCLKIQTQSNIQIFLNDKILQMTPQQKEILCILAIYPQGLELTHLHQALYGERKISLDTLKAEMSKIKCILMGLMSARSYQLLLDVKTDFLQIEQALDSGQIQYAKQLYHTDCLANVKSPFLAAWRACLESRLISALEQKTVSSWAEQ